MFGPRVAALDGGYALLAEFWDCHRLDTKPVSDLRKALESYLARGGVPVLLVDLSGVGFAGSAVLGGFVGMRKLGVRVIFYNVEPAVREIFAMTQLERFFQFAADRDAARALIDQASPGQPGDPQPPAVPTSTPPVARAATVAAPPLRRARRTTG